MPFKATFVADIFLCQRLIAIVTAFVVSYSFCFSSRSPLTLICSLYSIVRLSSSSSRIGSVRSAT